MRLLISASHFGLSGVVTATYNLVKFLVARGGYQILVVGDERGYYISEFERLGVKCAVVSGRPLFKALRLYEIINDWAPAVFIPGFSAYEYIYMHRFPRGTKVLQIIHSDHQSWYEKLRHVNGLADAFIFVSGFLKEQLLPQALCPGYYIPNFVHINPAAARLRSYRGKLNVLYTGRLVQEAKQVLDLPEILRGIPNLEFHFAGRGEEADLLVSGLRAAGVEHIYHGLLGRPEVESLYALSDVFILPSDYEGLPLSLLEAMSFGCVPVVSRVRSGVTDVVDDSDGYVVDVRDIEGFRAILSELVVDRQALHQKSETCRERIVRSFSADVCGPQYEEAIQMVARAAARHPQKSWLPRPLPGRPLF